MKLIKAKPNYTMLRLENLEKNTVKEKYPDSDQMVKPYVFSGYDIKMIEPLSVLKYIYGIETQFSCQGNHKDYLSHAYILLAPHNSFPQELVSRLENSGFILSIVPDVIIDNKMNFVETSDTREKLWIGKDEKITKDNLILKNDIFMKILNEWSTEEIKKHLEFMTDKYYADFVKLYAS